MSAIVSYQPTTFGELESLAARLAKSKLVPTFYQGKPDEIMVAIMAGNEWGLPPMASLQAIAVINGKPSVYGDAMPGIAFNKGVIADMEERFDGEEGSDAFAAVCIVTRPSGSKVEQRFSVADAKRASLWGKSGPWQSYPKRMLQWRARSWAIRDAAPHLFFGMSAEEAEDLERTKAPQRRGPDAARDVTPPAPSAPVEQPVTVEAEVVEAIEVDDNDPLRINGIKGREAFTTLQWALEDADAAEADKLCELYKHRIEKLPANLREIVTNIVVGKIKQEFPADEAVPA